MEAINLLSLLPSELSNIIYSYLDYKELRKMYNINWEVLFSYGYPEIYGLMKKIFKYDMYLRKYSNAWELFFEIFEKYDYNHILLSIKDRHNIFHRYEKNIDVIEDNI